VEDVITSVAVTNKIKNQLAIVIIALVVRRPRRPVL
jgi:hypothetical protein